jgi:signal transduction histidine kinase
VESDDAIILHIADDGRGMDAATLSPQKSLGLVGMRERCVLLGGQLAIVSLPGQGTQIEARIPK